MRLSLRSWLLLVCFLPVWLFILLGGLWLLNSYFATLEQQLVSRGQLTLKNLSPSLAIKLEDRERLPGLHAIAEQLLEAADVRAFSLYDHQRNNLLYAGPSMRPLTNPSKQRWSEDSQLAVEEETLRFVEPIYQLQSRRDLARLGSGVEPLLLGWAELELVRTPTLLHQYRLLLAASLLLLLFLGLSFLQIHYFSVYLSQRMEQLAAALGRLAKGETPEVAVQAQVFELDALGQRVQALISSVSQREEQLTQTIEEIREDSSRSLETIEIRNIELDRARKEALQASRIKSEFLANMSHEIRTPLNGIVGFSNLLSRTRLDGRQKEYLGHILGASETMLGIVNDVLDFSKIEAGKLVLEEGPVDLRELMDTTLPLLAPQAHRQQLELLGLVYDDVPRLVKSDPLRLRQLLTNLISNALKFTVQGEVVVRVMLDDEDPAEPQQAVSRVFLRIAVSDTGIGLNEEQRQKLFQAFSQANTSQTRQFGGTGLGLAICKQLVQQMGGQIDLQSEEGQGSVFWFRLPVEVLEVAAEPLPWLRGKKLAILESHRLTAQAWAHQLRSWGAEVESWQQPEQLVDSLQQQCFSALLVGLNAKQSSSLIWLDALEQSKRFCPSLLLLNTSEPEIHTRLKSRISDHLLLKPASSLRLKLALESLLEEQQTMESVPLAAGVKEKIGQAPILAVDDTPSNLLLLTTLLQQLGFETLQARSGEEAVERVTQDEVCLILMDIQMPGMNGVEATQAIRSLGHAYRSLPIIALTAHAIEDERSVWLQSGFNDVLIKPLDEKLLLDVLQRWLGGCFNVNQDSESALRLAFEDEESLSPVDRELGIRLAAGRPELADELMGLLLDSLPQSSQAIQEALDKEDKEALLDAVHRLHGASRYCGVPYLAQTTEALETQIKADQMQRVEVSLERLFEEIQRLLDWQKKDYRPDWHLLPPC